MVTPEPRGRYPDSAVIVGFCTRRSVRLVTAGWQCVSKRQRKATQRTVVDHRDSERTAIGSHHVAGRDYHLDRSC